MSNLIINSSLGVENPVKHFNIYDSIVLLMYSFFKLKKKKKTPKNLIFSKIYSSMGKLLAEFN